MHSRLQIAIRISIFSVLLFVTWQVFTACNTAYYVTAPISRQVWQRYKTLDENIDNLFLGASHTFCGVNADELNELTGEVNFDLSSYLLKVDDNYYSLLQASEDNDLSHVYLDVSFELFCMKLLWASKDPLDFEMGHGNYSIGNLDFMPWSKSRISYIKYLSDYISLPELLFPGIRIRDDIYTPDKVISTISEKLSSEYLNYEMKEGDGYVSNYGYYYTEDIWTTADRNVCVEDIILGENPMGPNAESYLRECISYCKDNDIEITLYCSPIAPEVIDGAMGYDYYHEQVQTIAEEYGIEFYDFNLVNHEYLPLDEMEGYKDSIHLNATGAKLFTDLFYETVLEKTLDYDDVFLDTWSETKETMEPILHGIYYYYWDMDYIQSGIRNYYISASRDSGMEYYVEATYEDGSSEVLMDWSENTNFQVPAGRSGTFTVQVRMTDKPKEVIDRRCIRFTE